MNDLVWVRADRGRGCRNCGQRMLDHLLIEGDSENLACPAHLPPTIVRDYKVAKATDGWLLRCRTCNVGWSLKYPERGLPSIGSTLRLLNHARSHTAP
jgi:hypothetical protein